MSSREWIFINNTFEVNTRGTNKRMLTLATDTDSKLQAHSLDPDILAIYNDFHPVFLVYQQLWINYDIAAGNRQGETLNVEQLMKIDLSVQIALWEGKVRSVYPEGTPQEKAYFPNKRNPFYQGTYESRITAVGALAEKLALDVNATLTAYAPTVQSFYNLLLSSRNMQQQKEGLLGELSAVRENQRLLLADELYGSVLGRLMHKYRSSRAIIKQFFDLSLLRKTGMDVIDEYEGTLNAATFITLGTLPEGAKTFRLTVISGGPCEAGLGVVDNVFNGNTMTQGAPGSIENPIEYFNSTGNRIILQNQNLALPCQYKVEILG